MIGSLLIQPQMLARMQGRSNAEELGDEVMALLHRIVLDPAALQAIAPALQVAGDALGQRLHQHVQARLPQGLAAVQALLAPVLQRFTTLGASVASPAEIPGRIADALDALAASLDGLSDNGIRAFVRRVAQIAAQDFGLSTAVLTSELRRFLGEFRTELEVATDAGQAPTRHALGCLLGRLERELIPLFPVLDLNPDRLAGLLIAELRRTGALDLRDQAACLLGKLQAVLRALAEVARTVTVATPRAAPRGAALRTAPPGRRTALARAVPRAFGVPPRSEDAHYCWYASWLYATRLQGIGSDTPGAAIFWQIVIPGYPTDEVWQTADRKTLVLRRTVGADEVLYRSEAAFEWHQAPQFSGSTPVAPTSGAARVEHFVLKRIGAPFLEDWARVTAILADAAAGMWHVIAMATSPKERGANIPLWLWKWANAVSAGPAAPLPSLIAQKAGWGMGGKYVFSPLVAMLSVILGSLEGVHTKTGAGNGFLQWLTLLGGDALNAFTIHAVTQGLRDLSLSVFTLIDYEGPGQKPENGPDLRPRNWDMAGPLVGFVNTLLGMLFIKLIRREDHGLPIGGNPKPFLLWMFIGAPVMGFVGSFSGVLVGWGVGRTVTPADLWKKPALGALMGFLTFLVQMYGSGEGDTDDGRYNPNVDPQGNAFPVPRLPFAGYPPAAASPYRLPLPAGESTFVGQANQGFFSHMRYGSTVQVYAYDFAHDRGDEVLAVRDGTVVDWFDFYPDDTDLDVFGDTADGATGTAAAAAAQTAGLLVSGQTGFNGNLTGNWNFVLIRHDALDPAHDRDQGGGTVTTFAEYGHGLNGGVRAAFAARGVAPTAIIGTRVSQGQVVMQAGDTGVSFHNHLHLHVRAATAGTPVPPTPPAATFAPIRPTTLSAYTLPFVFREARHILGADGPLRHLTWYRSENTRLG